MLIQEGWGTVGGGVSAGDWKGTVRYLASGECSGERQGKGENPISEDVHGWKRRIAVGVTPAEWAVTTRGLFGAKVIGQLFPSLFFSDPELQGFGGVGVEADIMQG